LTSNTWLIYGANGYTGELIAREAVQRGLRPILSGRNREAVTALATSLGLEARIFGLDNPKAIEVGLKDCAVALHCAGPFSHTAKPMIEACLHTHTHYLDITGEIAVFELAATYDAVAKLANIMLLPGVGFDVVPTDCLAVHLKSQLPSATHLTLAFRGLGRASRGTTLTALESIVTGGMIRREGRLLPVPSGWKTRRIDFGNGRGPISTITIPWGDVATAYYSTGIPNIGVYIALNPKLIFLLRVGRYLRWLIKSAPVQRFLAAQIAALPPGPTFEQRERSTSFVWGEVRDDAGHTVTARFKTPDGYTLTVLTALAIVEKALSGHAPIGFQTPAKAYGPQLMFDRPDVTWLP
jgi:short subunit dehydrogenase-like uncharacterized protein